MAGRESSGQIEAGGRRLAWRTHGEGPPLLLINGYAATGADWDPTFLDGLAAAHEVICPDNRGIGESALGDDELTVDAMAADMEALLEALRLDRADVVGWSMGGFIAQRLAVRAPQRVASLALLATDPGGPDAVRAAPETWARLIDRSGSPREQASRLIPLLFPPSLAPDIDRQFGDLIATARAAMHPPALAAQEAAMAAWHQQHQVTAAPNNVPTLIVHGSEDEVIPAANADLLAAQHPGARVELIKGAAHAVMAQEPERVSKAICELTGARSA